MKKILVCFLFGIMVLLSTKKVFAASQLDLNRNGSIEIIMRDSKNNLVLGGALEVYKVANVYYDKQGYKYVYVAEFANAGYSLEKTNSFELVSGLNDYVLDKGIIGTVYDNTNGIIKMDDLSVGLYLIRPKSVPDGYEAIVPFLVSIPYQVGGDWIYEVNATPKMRPLDQETIEPEPTTEDKSEEDTSVTTTEERSETETSVSVSEEREDDTEHRTEVSTLKPEKIENKTEHKSEASISKPEKIENKTEHKTENKSENKKPNKKKNKKDKNKDKKIENEARKVKPKPIRTGDATPIMLCIVLMCTAAIASGICIAYNRKAD